MRAPCGASPPAPAFTSGSYTLLAVQNAVRDSNITISNPPDRVGQPLLLVAATELSITFFEDLAWRLDRDSVGCCAIGRGSVWCVFLYLLSRYMHPEGLRQREQQWWAFSTLPHHAPNLIGPMVDAPPRHLASEGTRVPSFSFSVWYVCHLVSIIPLPKQRRWAFLGMSIFRPRPVIRRTGPPLSPLPKTGSVRSCCVGLLLVRLTKRGEKERERKSLLLASHG